MIEVLVVVAIIAVLAAIGLPNLAPMVQNARLRTASSDFHAALLRARSEAIKQRGATVSLAPVGTGWTSGWQLTATTGGVASVLENHEALSPSVSVQVNVPASSTTSPIVYASTGRIASGKQLVIFYASSGSGAVLRARCVSIGTSGMPRILTSSTSDPTNGC